MNKSRLEWAQRFAALGISVFQVEPNSKRPLDGYSWYLRQTTDAAKIEQWFDQIPNCNYGLHWGENYVAVDLDIKPDANGVRAFEELCAEHGIEDFLIELDTLTVRTPGGGFHLIFKSPFPCGLSNDFERGIDVRGATGYTVGVGSADSRGEWKLVNDAEIASLPEWLEDYVRPPGHKDPNHDVPVTDLDHPENVEHAVEWLKDREPAFQGQNGDDWTYETAQFLRDFGLSQGKIFEVLNVEWNQRCDPMWGDEELEAKIRNAWTYGQNRPGVKSSTYKAERVNLAHSGDRWAEHLTEEAIAELFRPSFEKVLASAAQAQDDEVPTDEDPVDGLLKDVREWAMVEQFREFLVWRTLPAFGQTWMISKRGTGKSTTCVDMGMHIASDLDWCDRPSLKGYRVVFLALEDADGVRMSCRAWMQEHQQPDPDRFMAVDEPLKIMSAADMNRLSRAIARWAKGEPVLIVLDTWQRTTSGTNRSGQEEMDKAVEYADGLCKALNAALLIAAHPPKDGRMTVKGAGEQEDTSSCLLVLEKTAQGHKMTVTRMKGEGEGSYVEFRRHSVALIRIEDGQPVTLVDKHGKPRTTLVLEPVGGDVDPDRLAAATGGLEAPEHAKPVAAALDIVTAEDDAPSWSLSSLANRIRGLEYRDDETGRVETVPNNVTTVRRAIMSTFQWHGMQIECENNEKLIAGVRPVELKGGKIRDEWEVKRA